MKRTTRAPATLEPVRRRHYAALARFLATFPGETRAVELWLDRMRLWWDLNPAFSERQEAGWMLCRGARIVGFLGNVPLAFQARHRPCVAFAGTTWRVLPEYRRYSLDLLFEQVRHAEGSLLFGTTVGRVTRPMMEKSRKTALLPRPGSRWLRVLDVSPDQRRRLRGLLADRGLVAVSPPVGGGAAARGGGDADVVELQAANDDVDRLWQRTRSRWAFTNRRTAAVVGWYCFASPYFRKTLLGVYQGGELQGFLVSAIEQKSGFALWNVLDVWLDPARPELLETALRSVCSRARESGCDAVRLPPLPAELTGPLAALGFEPYRETVRSDFVRIGKRFGGGIPSGDAYFTDAQGDVGL